MHILSLCLTVISSKGGRGRGGEEDDSPAVERGEPGPPGALSRAVPTSSSKEEGGPAAAAALEAMSARVRVRASTRSRGMLGPPAEGAEEGTKECPAHVHAPSRTLASLLFGAAGAPGQLSSTPRNLEHTPPPPPHALHCRDPAWCVREIGEGERARWRTLHLLFISRLAYLTPAPSCPSLSPNPGCPPNQRHRPLPRWRRGWRRRQGERGGAFSHACEPARSRPSSQPSLPPSTHTAPPLRRQHGAPARPGRGAARLGGRQRW